MKGEHVSRRARSRVGAARRTHADKPVPGLELLLRGLVIVDEGKAGRTASTEDGLEAEADDAGGVGLVHGGELLRKLGPRDVGPVRVQDVKHELLAGKQPVGDELPSTEGNGGVRLQASESGGSVTALMIMACRRKLLPLAAPAFSIRPGPPLRHAAEPARAPLLSSLYPQLPSPPSPRGPGADAAAGREPEPG